MRERARARSLSARELSELAERCTAATIAAVNRCNDCTRHRVSFVNRSIRARARAQILRVARDSASPTCGNPSRFLIAATSAAVQRTTRLHLEDDSRLAESATAEMSIVVIDVRTGWSILARSGSDSKRMPSRSGARHRAVAGGRRASSRAVGITEATVKIYSVIITIRRLGGTSDI